MKLEGMNCPKCGSPLNFTEDQDFCFCSHCGTQVYKNNSSHFTYRKIDDAKIRQAEANEKVGLAKIKAKANEEIVTVKALLLCFAGIAIIFGAIGLVGGFFEKRSVKEREAINAQKEAQGMIEIGIHRDECLEKNYETIRAQFEARGFTDIELVDLNDAGLFKNKKDTVESVSVGGDSNFSVNDYVFPDTKVIISYH